MDSVQRLQVYESSTALLKGIYSGFVDASKIDKNELNFMREISLKINFYIQKFKGGNHNGIYIR